MEIQDLAQSDIPFISDLLPLGWEGEIPTIGAYTQLKFCFPVKVCIENKMVGIGTAIIHQGTAWLAHIIVHPEYRNQHIGTAISRALLETARAKGCDTIYLLSTELGEPVYRKLGFETETEYLIFERKGTNNRSEQDEHIVAMNSAFKNKVTDLDRQVTGEDRALLFEPHLSDGLIYLQDGIVQGFYLPNLGDGLIIATSGQAGQALMNVRLATRDYAAFPMDNVIGADYLKQNNFSAVRSEQRMRLGKQRNWQPRHIYNIIGGNFG